MMVENQDCPKKLKTALSKANNRCKEQKSRLDYSKTDTQKALIEPIINALGWDITDESKVMQKCTLYRDNNVEEMADYALFANKYDNIPLIKIISQKLGSIKNAEQEIEHYNDISGRIDVATDGFCWSVYNNNVQSKITIDSNIACKELQKHLGRSVVMKLYNQEQKAISKYISDEFQNILKYYKIFPPSKKDIQDRINTNKAVQLFSVWTLQNNDKLDTPDNFRKMMHVYRNILFWNRGIKRALPIKLNVLSELGLKPNLIEKITDLSNPGRYIGIQRRFEDFSYSSDDRNMFFKLINAFIVTDTSTDELYEMTVAFAPRLQIGTAALTGIVSALRPEEFMVYNLRSLMLIDELYPDNYFHDMYIESYREFNDLYKRIGKETKQSLVHLDYYTNEIF